MALRNYANMTCMLLYVLCLTIANASTLKKEASNGPWELKPEAEPAATAPVLGDYLSKKDFQNYNELSNLLDEESKSPGEMSASKSGGNAAVFDSKPALDATAEPTEDELSDHELPDLDLKDEGTAQPPKQQQNPQVPATHPHEEHVVHSEKHEQPSADHLPTPTHEEAQVHPNIDHFQHVDDHDHILGDFEKHVSFVPEHGVVRPHGLGSFEHVIHHVVQAQRLPLHQGHNGFPHDDKWHRDAVLSSLHVEHPDKVWNSPGKLNEKLRGFAATKSAGPTFGRGETNRICDTVCNAMGVCHQECFCSKDPGCLCTKEMRLLTSICDVLLQDPDIGSMCTNPDYNTNPEHYTDVISNAYPVVRHSLCSTRLHTVCK
ncbi:signal peptide containing protein [Theileria equi strain WA]|uniref:Signal peptide containing protein n=1 Tax=Theileria equi strain WA TaxID=1537102 RepID=L1LG76_THEEQ|nr:signal peptide containing protein [Theileria equi strain WA]EKX74361.1 signal peptide containing protein [Theileria equi strain WA]|eukprot:XP_004833813.1 signal peptide containing protein [Theileria equi strain WA]